MAHGNKRKQYLKVFVALTVLTALELGVVKTGLSKGMILSALLLLALAKATAVALWYMHLMDETKWLRWIIGGTLLTLPTLYAFVLIFEAIARGTHAF